MEKKTLYALIALVVLGAGAFAVMRAPEKGQRSGPRPRPIPEMKAAEVTALELTSDKQDKTVLEKAGDKWRVKSPSDVAADASAVKTLLDGLEKLGFGDLVTESADKQAEMGVADGKGGRVVVKGAGGKVLADLLVGKSVGGFTMVRPAGKNEIWQASGLYPYMLNKDARGWRDHVIFEFTAADADALTVEAGASTLALEKLPPEGDQKGGEAKWKIAKATGDAPKTSDVLDTQLVNGAVGSLASLRAADFVDDKKAGDIGLQPALVTVTVTAKGKTYKLLVGSTKGDDVYVQAADAPTLYTVKKYSLERVMHRPVDYRDKTITKIKEIDIASADITVGSDTTSVERSGDKWKGRGKSTADDAKVKAALGGFESLAGSSFADSRDAATTGLGKPTTGQVVLHLKDKSTVTIKVGAASKDNTEYYVQKVGAPDVLMVKKYAVDRFLKKAADLGGAAPAAKPDDKKKKK